MFEDWGFFLTRCRLFHRPSVYLNRPRADGGHEAIFQQSRSSQIRQAQFTAADTTQRSKETIMKNQIARSLAVVLALVLGMACTQSASAQTCSAAYTHSFDYYNGFNPKVALT